jgi:hypothetical protein
MQSRSKPGWRRRLSVAGEGSQTRRFSRFSVPETIIASSYFVSRLSNVERGMWNVEMILDASPVSSVSSVSKL